MQMLEIHPEDYPYALSNTATTNAATTRRGDVEISHDQGDSHKVLTVIPKAKRAELAKFLLEAE